jgi:hypothetical protein
VPVSCKLFDETRGRERLQLALVLELELPARHVVDEDERPVRLRCGDLRDEGDAREVGCPRRHVQVDLVHRGDRPAARDRRALPVRFTLCLVRHVEVGAEQVDDLVVLLGRDRLDERDEVRAKLTQPADEHPPARRPVPTPAPQVQRQHPHLLIYWRFVVSPPSRGLAISPKNRRASRGDRLRSSRRRSLSGRE